MRREGRMHGSAIRLRRDDPPEGIRSPNKPKNHSKMSGRRLKIRNGICSRRFREVPLQKSLAKTKGVFKAKHYDVTTNHRLNDWSLRYSSQYLHPIFPGEEVYMEF